MDNDGIVLNLASSYADEDEELASFKDKTSAKSNSRLLKKKKPSSAAVSQPLKLEKKNVSPKTKNESEIGKKLAKKRSMAKMDDVFEKSLPAKRETQQKKVKEKLPEKKTAAAFKTEKSFHKSTDSSISKKKTGDQDVFTGDQFSAIGGLNKKLLDRLEKEDGFGFTRMTTIQKLTIPKLLAGSDCFVKSQTGSGKTLAYAVPCVQKLSEMEPRIRRQDGPYAIILTPTRELTIQTYEVFEKLLKACIWIVPGYIAGGEKRKSEKARLRKGINVLVCTPGRLTDHLRQTSCLSMEKVQWIIYDEADRLLDGGFEKDVRSIIDRLRESGNEHCQSVLLSATLNKSVTQLAELALKNPVFLTPASTDIGIESDGSRPAADNAYVLPASLKQSYIVMPAKQRLLTLIALILSKFKVESQDRCEKMLIFLATQDAVDFHYSLLDHIINSRESDGDDVGAQKRKRFRPTEDEDGLVNAIEVYRLHGNMSQQERTAVYKEFSGSKKALLLATDVASRGLHIPRLDCIVQYNTPGAAAEYVHRVGRTARMGQTGDAILFLLPSELPYLDVLREYKIEMQEMRQSEFMDALKEEADVSHLPEALHIVQQKCEEFVYARNDVYEMATKAFVSFVRSYTTYPSQLKEIFNVRALHLGHLANCFALKETPKELASFRPRGDDQRHHHQIRGARNSFGSFRRDTDMRKRQWDSRGSGQSYGRDNSFKRRRPADMSEFGSGFDSIQFR